MTGVPYGLVELNQIVGNRYHDTENKAIQLHAVDISGASVYELWLVSEVVLNRFSQHLASTPAPLQSHCLQRTENFAKLAVIF